MDAGPSTSAPVEAEPGRVSFTLGPSEFHPNPSGLVHGEEPLTEPDDMVIVASPGHRYEAP